MPQRNPKRDALVVGYHYTRPNHGDIWGSFGGIRIRAAERALKLLVRFRPESAFRFAWSDLHQNIQVSVPSGPCNQSCNTKLAAISAHRANA